MIFVTVGTQLPFDRLTRLVDQLVLQTGIPAVGQVGNSSMQLSYPHKAFMSGEEYSRNFAGCRVVISHAGVGSILSAQKFNKPIILFPRLHKFGEHRNDHQLATCDAVKDRMGIWIATDFQEVSNSVSQIMTHQSSGPSAGSGRSSFIRQVTELINGL